MWARTLSFGRSVDQAQVECGSACGTRTTSARSDPAPISTFVPTNSTWFAAFTLVRFSGGQAKPSGAAAQGSKRRSGTSHMTATRLTPVQDPSYSPRSLLKTARSCQAPARHCAPRKTPSRWKPAFSRARCSATFSTSVSASTLLIG